MSHHCKPCPCCRSAGLQAERPCLRPPSQPSSSCLSSVVGPHCTSHQPASWLPQTRAVQDKGRQHRRLQLDSPAWPRHPRPCRQLRSLRHCCHQTTWLLAPVRKQLSWCRTWACRSSMCFSLQPNIWYRMLLRCLRDHGMRHLLRCCVI